VLAHLKRDFQKIVDGNGPSAFVGRRGGTLVKKVFAAWHTFQAGQTTRAQLQAELDPVANRLQRVLLEGALLGEDQTVATFCENCWRWSRRCGRSCAARVWSRRTTSGAVAAPGGVVAARSFGCVSVAGCRFVERILTVVQTRRLQGQSVLDYLHAALRAHRAGQPCPKMLTAG